MINNFNINDFLQNYWQKKPLLIRGAFTNNIPSIPADELAGLACEDFVESRIISEQQNQPKWHVKNGPFAESHFATLPKTHWTLLIQGMNKLFPDFDDLLHEFNFIPSWRVDDVMASYSVESGSVGPHIDQYDVFLLQASGQKKWMVSQQPVGEKDIEADLPLKIIKNFNAESEWVLEAGDMLYLPPNMAHYGIALNEGMTFSIGFRAPSHAELFSAYLDDSLVELKDDLRFRDFDLHKDHNLSNQSGNGEISKTTLQTIHQLFESHFSDSSKIEDWFGRYITQYMNDAETFTEHKLSVTEFKETFKKNNILRKSASVNANYLLDINKQLKLYINGENYDVKLIPKEIVILICDKHEYLYQDLLAYLDDTKSANFLCDLYNLGYLEFLV